LRSGPRSGSVAGWRLSVLLQELATRTLASLPPRTLTVYFHDGSNLLAYEDLDARVRTVYATWARVSNARASTRRAAGGGGSTPLGFWSAGNPAPRVFQEIKAEGRLRGKARRAGGTARDKASSSSRRTVEGWACGYGEAAGPVLTIPNAIGDRIPAGRRAAPRRPIYVESVLNAKSNTHACAANVAYANHQAGPAAGVYVLKTDGRPMIRATNHLPDVHVQRIQFGPRNPYPMPPALQDAMAEPPLRLDGNTEMLRQRIQQIEHAPSLRQTVLRMLRSLVPSAAS